MVVDDERVPGACGTAIERAAGRRSRGEKSELKECACAVGGRRR